MFTLVTICFTGCGFSSPVVPGHGVVYSNFSSPLDINFDKTDLGTKQGEASTTSFFGIVTIGDCSTHEAAKNGNIQTIKHADYKYFNVLGIYSKYTTIVYGD